MTHTDFEALSDFNESLDELGLMIKLSEGYKKLNRPDKRALMQRATVLFLGTHIECFFESIAEEYIYKIEQLELPRNKVPEKLLMGSVQFHVNDQLLSKINKRSLKCKETLVKLAKIVSCSSPVTELKIDTGFSYGKHGSNEVIKLFDRLDVENIFDHCKVLIEVESMLSEEMEVKQIDIANKFNVLTGTRNSLIHQFKVPREDILMEVIQDIEYYREFAAEVSKLLASKVNALEAAKAEAA
ncbi:HEPN domain-containing protein [Vibrio owensii]